MQSLGFVSTAVRQPGFAIRGRSLSYRGGTRPARGTRRVSGGDSGRCTRCFAIIKASSSIYVELPVRQEVFLRLAVPPPDW